MMKLASFALAAGVCALVGCASPTSSAEEANPVLADGADEELKSADCPATVEVTIAKPRVMTDAKLTELWTKDFQSWGTDNKAEAQAEAAQQLTDLSSHIASARSEGAIKLRGTLGKACFYATVDAKTGKKNGYSLWFAKTTGRNGGFQLRVLRDLGTPDDTLFFQVPVKALSPTTLTVDTSADMKINAHHNIPEYHGEPGGPNALIGYTDATAKIVH